MRNAIKKYYLRTLTKLLSPFMNSFLNENLPKQLLSTSFMKYYRVFINHNIEFVDYDEAEDLIYLKKDNLYLVTTSNYAHIVKEVFCMYIYFINPKYFKKKEYAVFDIGMNRGYATIFFASHSWCKKVYGFELNETTYKIADKNVQLNTPINHKIKTYNFGLSDKDEKVVSYYLPHRDGICTTDKNFLLQYAPEERDRILEVESVVKKSSSTLKDIVDSDNLDSVIVKIDAEGAEYAIFNDIVSEYPAFLHKVDIIIGEVHSGIESLARQLLPFGFTDVSTKKSNPKTQDFLFVKNAV